MTDHSIQGYFYRMPTRLLEGFLYTCMQNGKWGKYANSIFLAFEALEKREDRNQVLEARLRREWKMYCDRSSENGNLTET